MSDDWRGLPRVPDAEQDLEALTMPESCLAMMLRAAFVSSPGLHLHHLILSRKRHHRRRRLFEPARRDPANDACWARGKSSQYPLRPATSYQVYVHSFPRPPRVRTPSHLDCLVFASLEKLARLRGAEDVAACHNLLESSLQRPSMGLEHALSSANLRVSGTCPLQCSPG